jgi:L-lysine exporter family protein LysE/ArgO
MRHCSPSAECFLFKYSFGVPLPFTASLAGLGFGLSLIVAIGAQNAFVLRQGLRREHVLLVVAICAISDAALIAIGVSGIGALIQRVTWLLTVIELIGGLFLATYGTLAARRAVRPNTLNSESGGQSISRRVAVLTILGLTFLNPHVYLDTVLLLGSIATTYGEYQWWFAAGAMTGSLLWFSALGFGARLLAPVFRSTSAWRILDAIIALVMYALAVTLLVSFANHISEFIG